MADLTMLNETTTELLTLLAGCPAGEYLTELREGVRVLWRISEGAPPDGAEEPAVAWTLSTERLSPTLRAMMRSPRV